jgi:hypothetical protein
MWCLERPSLRGAAGIALIFCLLPMPTHAVLGERVVALMPAAAPGRASGSAPANPITNKPLAATRIGAAGVQVHTHQGADGAQIREYTGTDGRVFAVGWSTRSKPRLDLLLGSYFESYAMAARAEQNIQRRPRHAARTEQGDLIVQSQGHAQAFTGVAYLRSRLPAAVTVDDLR